MGLRHWHLIERKRIPEAQTSTRMKEKKSWANVRKRKEEKSILDPARKGIHWSSIRSQEKEKERWKLQSQTLRKRKILLALGITNRL